MTVSLGSGHACLTRPYGICKLAAATVHEKNGPGCSNRWMKLRHSHSGNIQARWTEIVS